MRIIVRTVNPARPDSVVSTKVKGTPQRDGSLVTRSGIRWIDRRPLNTAGVNA